LISGMPRTLLYNSTVFSMSEQTSATWLMPLSWNSEFGLFGLITPRLLGYRPGDSLAKKRNLNLTSGSDLNNAQRGERRQ
jgi:hypothetical protein